MDSQSSTTEIRRPFDLAPRQLFPFPLLLESRRPHDPDDTERDQAEHSQTLTKQGGSFIGVRGIRVDEQDERRPAVQATCPLNAVSTLSPLLSDLSLTMELR